MAGQSKQINLRQKLLLGHLFGQDIWLIIGLTAQYLEELISELESKIMISHLAFDHQIKFNYPNGSISLYRNCH